MLDRWSLRFAQLVESRPFAELERLLAFRTHLLLAIRDALTLSSHGAQSALHTEPVTQYLLDNLILTARLALESGEPNTTRLALQRFTDLQASASPLQQLEARIQEIKLCWTQSDKQIALGLLNDLLQQRLSSKLPQTYENCVADTDLLCLLGKWSSQSKSLNPQQIVDRYLVPAATKRDKLVNRPASLQHTSPSFASLIAQGLSSSSSITSTASFVAPGQHTRKEYYQLARFCDNILDEMASDETHQRFEQLRREREHELKVYRQMEQDAGSSSAADKAIKATLASFKRKLERQVEMDRKISNERQRQVMRYLVLSVECYMKTLVREDALSNVEETVFRFCSLWFESANVPDVQSAVERLVGELPTRRFLILMYQMSARLVNTRLNAATSPEQGDAGGSGSSGHTTKKHAEDESMFSALLERLVLRIICDFPHHSLPHLLALKNGADITNATSTTNVSASSKRHQAAGSHSTSATGPAHRAKQILDKLAHLPRKSSTSSTGVTVHTIAQHTDRLFKLYIQVSNVVVDKTIKRTAGQPNVFDSRLMISTLQEDLFAPVVTIEQPAVKAMDYDNIVHVCSFGKTYKLPGGVNVPKVIECFGSDGNMYLQLVKGNDDLRQDAVLSSVFSMVNVLLSKHFETRKRQLRIRTYRIIPMSPQAGVVQWVNGTVPIGNLLMDGHTRYHPNQWTSIDCRKRMTAENENPASTPASKLATYNTIERNFTPVLSRIFLEKYTDSRQWYANRQQFIQSLAASSMAGYVVGLGDRHSQNILFDEGSAEVVHIDLGIAFDQGKVLPYPELVPFRLTRNLVDGMGLTGVNGFFRRGCEETMQVLRIESHAILTLLDVFRHDPLYSWKISPLKMMNVQQQAKSGSLPSETDAAVAAAVPNRAQRRTSRGSKGGVDDVGMAVGVADGGYAAGAEAEAGIVVAPGRTRATSDDAREAERAMFAVRTKLGGITSVECQVAQLISSATDAGNLCRMFQGWAAWL
eukprot:jgi/Hompol1/5521/HPOL_004490-RA